MRTYVIVVIIVCIIICLFFPFTTGCKNKTNYEEFTIKKNDLTTVAIIRENTVRDLANATYQYILVPYVKDYGDKMSMMNYLESNANVYEIFHEPVNELVTQLMYMYGEQVYEYDVVSSGQGNEIYLDILSVYIGVLIKIADEYDRGMYNIKNIYDEFPVIFKERLTSGICEVLNNYSEFKVGCSFKTN